MRLVYLLERRWKNYKFKMNTNNRIGENNSKEQGVDSGRISSHSSDRMSNFINSPDQIETK